MRLIKIHIKQIKKIMKPIYNISKIKDWNLEENI
jgi:hypothetical protein